MMIAFIYLLVAALQASELIHSSKTETLAYEKSRDFHVELVFGDFEDAMVLLQDPEMDPKVSNKNTTNLDIIIEKEMYTLLPVLLKHPKVSYCRIRTYTMNKASSLGKTLIVHELLKNPLTDLTAIQWTPELIGMLDTDTLLRGRIVTYFVDMTHLQFSSISEMQIQWRQFLYLDHPFAKKIASILSLSGEEHMQLPLKRQAMLHIPILGELLKQSEKLAWYGMEYLEILEEAKKDFPADTYPGMHNLIEKSKTKLSKITMLRSKFTDPEKFLLDKQHIEGISAHCSSRPNSEIVLLMLENSSVAPMEKINWAKQNLFLSYDFVRARIISHFIELYESNNLPAIKEHKIFETQNDLGVPLWKIMNLPSDGERQTALWQIACKEIEQLNDLPALQQSVLDKKFDMDKYWEHLDTTSAEKQFSDAVDSIPEIMKSPLFLKFLQRQKEVLKRYGEWTVRYFPPAHLKKCVHEILEKR